MDKGLGDITYVNEISFGVGLEENQETIVDRPVDKIVDQKIESHPRAHAEGGGQPKGDAAGGIENHFLGFDFEPAVQGHRFERRFLGTRNVLFADPIPAVSSWEDQHLPGTFCLENETNAVDDPCVPHGSRRKAPVKQARGKTASTSHPLANQGSSRGRRG